MINIIRCLMAITLMVVAYGLGYVNGLDTTTKSCKELFRHYTTTEKAYENGIKVGFDKGWTACADYCIDKYCWNLIEYGEHHKQELVEALMEEVNK